MSNIFLLNLLKCAIYCMSICILMSNIEKIVYIKILYFHEKDLRIWNYLYFDENREKFT